MKSKLYDILQLDKVDYNPDAGTFTWTVDTARKKAGDAAGSYGAGQYWKITIHNRSYSAQRLAWLIVTGYEAEGRIRFIDSNKLNFKACNMVCRKRTLASYLAPTAYRITPKYSIPNKNLNPKNNRDKKIIDSVSQQCMYELWALRSGNSYWCGHYATLERAQIEQQIRENRKPEFFYIEFKQDLDLGHWVASANNQGVITTATRKTRKEILELVQSVVLGL